MSSPAANIRRIDVICQQCSGSYGSADGKPECVTSVGKKVAEFNA